MSDFVYIIAGLVLLVLGSHLLITGAVNIAQSYGISDVVIGLTVIAVGTSLPELATSAVAAYKNESDIAFGNAIGSNVLNILAVLGFTAMVSPIYMGEIRTLDLGAMVGSGLILLLLLGRKYILARPEGALLIIGYLVYLYTVVP
ncbi:hypothetical protein BH20ACI2_BH20ACI2_01750 [soil metagenome]